MEECTEPKKKCQKTQSYRQAKKELQALPPISKMDLTNEEKFALCVSEYLKNTTAVRQHKCPKCWLVTGTTNSCICAQLAPLSFSVPVRFLILIHYKEWFNAGDDSKILLNAAPNQTQLFVYGREGDEEKLQSAVDDPESSTLLLFPSDTSISVEEYMKRYHHISTPNVESKQTSGSCDPKNANNVSGAGGDSSSSSSNSSSSGSSCSESRSATSSGGNGEDEKNSTTIPSTALTIHTSGGTSTGSEGDNNSSSGESSGGNNGGGDDSGGNSSSSGGGGSSGSGSGGSGSTSQGAKRFLNILVLDGTWTQVRSMKKYFQRKIDPQNRVPEVALSPLSLEYWKSRGSTSVYKRTQTQGDRVCTIEAVALLLRELGETVPVCDALIRYVQINNVAISPATAH